MASENKVQRRVLNPARWEVTWGYSCTAWNFVTLSLPLSLLQIWLWRRNHRWRDWCLLYEKSIHQHTRNFAYMYTWRINTLEGHHNTHGSPSFISEAHDLHDLVLPLTCTIREAHFFYNLLILFYLLWLPFCAFTSKADISKAYYDIIYGLYSTSFLRVFRTAWWSLSRRSRNT
jgi:hypothetical protein